MPQKLWCNIAMEEESATLLQIRRRSGNHACLSRGCIWKLYTLVVSWKSLPNLVLLLNWLHRLNSSAIYSWKSFKFHLSGMALIENIKRRMEKINFNSLPWKDPAMLIDLWLLIKEKRVPWKGGKILFKLQQSPNEKDL